MNLDQETKEAARKEIIREYVDASGLDVSAYKDFGEPRVEL